MWTNSTNELPLLRVITQEHLERLEVAQTLTQTVLTSQLRQVVRSIQAGAPVLPGERRVVYLSSTQCPGIRVEEQKSAFQLAIENRDFPQLVAQEMEFHCQVFREADQNLRRVNHLASATQAHNIGAQIEQYIQNCDYISQSRCGNNKVQRMKDKCLLRTARFILLVWMRSLDCKLFWLSRKCARAFALLDMSSFTASVNSPGFK
jgi:hypothetical protein